MQQEKSALRRLTPWLANSSCRWVNESAAKFAIRVKNCAVSNGSQKESGKSFAQYELYDIRSFRNRLGPFPEARPDSCPVWLSGGIPTFPRSISTTSSSSRAPQILKNLSTTPSDRCGAVSLNLPGSGATALLVRDLTCFSEGRYRPASQRIKGEQWNPKFERVRFNQPQSTKGIQLEMRTRNKLVMPRVGLLIRFATPLR